MHYCFQEKKTVRIVSTVLKRTCALLFSGEGNRRSTVSKRTGSLLFSGEGNCRSSVSKRTGALLFS